MIFFTDKKKYCFLQVEDQGQRILHSQLSIFFPHYLCVCVCEFFAFQIAACYDSTKSGKQVKIENAKSVSVSQQKDMSNMMENFVLQSFSIPRVLKNVCNSEVVFASQWNEIKKKCFIE